jgi:hypothetical protein
MPVAVNAKNSSKQLLAQPSALSFLNGASRRLRFEFFALAATGMGWPENNKFCKWHSSPAG